MHRILSPSGATISYDRYGRGPALVLVHGAFSDHHTNWEFVRPIFENQFTVYAIARRGRGETDATADHSLQDEANDVATLIEAIGERVFLLGHSYGAHAALAATAKIPHRVRKLVLYEPAWPTILSKRIAARMESLALAGDWESFAITFFHDGLFVPLKDLAELRASNLWAPIVADAPASFRDLRALARHDFRPEHFRGLTVPVMLQIGTESPRHLYATDALAAALPDAWIVSLPGQAHEGMTTAPQMYAESVSRFLLEDVALAA